MMREEAKQLLFIVNGRQSLTISMYNRKIMHILIQSFKILVS